MSTPTLTGSLEIVMNNLVAIEETVHDDLRVYLWRPRTPDLPCLWNWIIDAPFEQRDQARWRDNVNVSVTIGIRHTDLNEEMGRLIDYADSFRNIVDQELYRANPLGAQWAKRQSMRMTRAEFGGADQVVPVLAVEFPILMQLDRIISPL